MSQLHTPITYVLPLRSSVPHTDRDFCEYLKFISSVAQTVVVDGSEAAVFQAHSDAWGEYVTHLPPDPALSTPMGKVGGALTGLRLAAHDNVIIADDDIRYDMDALTAVAKALDDAEVVRPQNYFSPLPWHAVWDSGRILLNRVTGGDWPGTLGVQRDHLLSAGGYDGTVMFENLELVRTVIAAGGREKLLAQTFVERRPSSTKHFFSQRVRQAYDEFARPGRMAIQLLLLPAAVTAVILGDGRAVVVVAIAAIVAAEFGRRRGGASKFFSFTASLAAPFWLGERAVCVWLAVAARAIYGGIPYRGTVLRRAATPMREIRKRLVANGVVTSVTPGPRYRSA